MACWTIAETLAKVETTLLQRRITMHWRCCDSGSEKFANVCKLEEETQTGLNYFRPIAWRAAGLACCGWLPDALRPKDCWFVRFLTIYA